MEEETTFFDAAVQPKGFGEVNNEIAVNPIENNYSGMSRTAKVNKLCEKMEEEKIDFIFVSSIEDVCWLLNLQGQG